MKIGVFDSGVGGMTVLHALRSRFPNNEYLYYGDTANVPYGTKSSTQIRTLCGQAAHYLKTENLDALVIACNTAASLALPEFTSRLGPVPVLNVVDAGVNTLLSELKQREGPILVLGTRATIKSKVYSRMLKDRKAQSQIFEQECPLLVPLIEEGWLDHPALTLTVREYLKPYLKLTPGIALLACTHYPWIQRTIEAELPQWRVLDSAHHLTEEAGRLLDLSKNAQAPAIRWIFTDPESVAPALFERFSFPQS